MHHTVDHEYFVLKILSWLKILAIYVCTYSNADYLALPFPLPSLSGIDSEGPWHPCWTPSPSLSPSCGTLKDPQISRVTTLAHIQQVCKILSLHATVKVKSKESHTLITATECHAFLHSWALSITRAHSNYTVHIHVGTRPIYVHA